MRRSFARYEKQSMEDWDGPARDSLGMLVSSPACGWFENPFGRSGRLVRLIGLFV